MVCHPLMNRNATNHIDNTFIWRAIISEVLLPQCASCVYSTGISANYIKERLHLMSIMNYL